MQGANLKSQSQFLKMQSSILKNAKQYIEMQSSILKNPKQYIEITKYNPQKCKTRYWNYMPFFTKLKFL